MVVVTEKRLAATAEAVARGELPDASQDLCPASLAPVKSQFSSKEQVVASLAASAQGDVVRRMKRKAATRVKTVVAAVDRGMDQLQVDLVSQPNPFPESDNEMEERISNDDFFIDVTGDDI